MQWIECVKIQTKIKDYIEGNLTPDELEEFVGHVNTCDECREELNIYYTLYLDSFSSITTGRM